LSALLGSKATEEELLLGRNARLALLVSSVLEALLPRPLALRASTARPTPSMQKKRSVQKVTSQRQALQLAPFAHLEVTVPKQAHPR